jgi:hypothetical protein
MIRNLTGKTLGVFCLCVISLMSMSLVSCSKGGGNEFIGNWEGKDTYCDPIKVTITRKADAFLIEGNCAPSFLGGKQIGKLNEFGITMDGIYKTLITYNPKNDTLEVERRILKRAK